MSIQIHLQYILRDGDEGYICDISDDKLGCWVTSNRNNAICFDSFTEAEQAAKELPHSDPGKINIISVTYTVVAVV